MYLGLLQTGDQPHGRLCSIARNIGVSSVQFPDLPIPDSVWFYSFFHTNNLNSLSDEEFYSLEDDYLIHFSDISSNQDTVKKHYKLIAGCLIFFGIECFVEAVFADVILVYHSGPVSDRRSG